MNLLQVRRLPVGDAIWIARHKQLESEYVLDFIVERKNVDDLRCSIRDNRYRDQKLRLLVLILIQKIRCFIFIVMCNFGFYYTLDAFWFAVVAKLFLLCDHFIVETWCFL